MARLLEVTAVKSQPLYDLDCGLSYWKRSALTVRKHFELNVVLTKRNNYIMNDDIVHGNFYFKKKLLLAWLEFEIVINIRVCKVVLQQHIEIRYRLIDNKDLFKVF
jgi:hypothetical protein